MLYLLDANVIITAKDSYYAIDQVPSFWTWLTHQGSSGILKIPSEIFNEVGSGSDKEPFYKWRKDKLTAESLVLAEAVDITILQKVINDGYASDLTDDQLISIGADPFLVAYAVADSSRTVVTMEVSKPSAKRNHRKLPDVCKQFDVKCITTFQMTRKLGWHVEWKP